MKKLASTIAFTSLAMIMAACSVDDGKVTEIPESAPSITSEIETTEPYLSQQPSAPVVKPKEDGFSNCLEARASGYKDIKKSDPRYREKLDRNKDGVACDEGELLQWPKETTTKASVKVESTVTVTKTRERTVTKVPAPVTETKTRTNTVTVTPPVTTVTETVTKTPDPEQ